MRASSSVASSTEREETRDVHSFRPDSNDEFLDGKTCCMSITTSEGVDRVIGQLLVLTEREGDDELRAGALSGGAPASASTPISRAARALREASAAPERDASARPTSAPSAHRDARRLESRDESALAA